MPFDPTRVKAILFDIDGTLSDTDDQWISRLNRALSPVRFLFPQRNPQPFARRLVMSMDAPGNAVFALLDRMNLDAPLARLSDRLRSKKKPVPHGGFRLVAGTSEMLETLHQRFLLGVVTARDKYTTRVFLDQFSLTFRFGAVASAQTCPHTKPYPDPVLWAAAQLGVEPQACVMVGDTVVDIRAGKAAGAQTVGVLCGFGSEDELRHADADLILPSPVEILTIMADGLVTVQSK